MRTTPIAGLRVWCSPRGSRRGPPTRTGTPTTTRSRSIGFAIRPGRTTVRDSKTPIRREALVGDEPYAALLPWTVFAVIDRAHGGWPPWGGVGAVITRGAVLPPGAPAGHGSRHPVFCAAPGFFGPPASGRRASP